MKTLTIEAYGLADYSAQLENAILNGYRVDISTNEHCPTNYGGFFTATVVKSEDKPEVTQKVQETETTEKVRKPRKTES